MDLLLIAVGASLAAGIATGLGALPVLVVRRLSANAQSLMLGFSAGVMLAASVFSLLLPALDGVELATGSALRAALVAGLGLLLGAIFLSLIHRSVPHEHFALGREGPVTERLARIWLFVLAIAIHNLPEGMAVGVGFSGGDLEAGATLALGIGLQNMPEGLAVAVALRSENYARSAALLVALATGLVEPLGAIVGALAVALSAPLLPWALAFAAGAMIFVVSDEIIPETHRERHAIFGTWGLMGGFVLMMLLDVTLA
ncbi:MAG: ZIP family metal transporter [Kiloniellales bacterium]